ncbi:MAG: tripartite tricarboxylate transporter substrate binding protein [Betaproteobacteria bacterium]
MQHYKKCLISMIGALLVGSTAMIHAAENPADWPTRPVKIIIPFSSGGGTDNLSRVLAQKLTQIFGQTFIVDNRPGGGGTIGAEQVARSTPDGYTLCIVSGSYSANPALHKLPYDPVNGITPISLLATGPLIVVASSSLKVKTFPELITYARTHPNEVSFGSTGIGSNAHLVGEMVDQITNVKMTHIPYKGAGPGLTDLLSGHLNLGYYTSVAVTPFIQSGKLKALAVTTENRVDSLPGVPTIKEFIPEFGSMEHWYGLWGPAGIPPEIVNRLNAAVSKVIDTPEMQERILAEGFSPYKGSPEDFRKRLSIEVPRWIKVAKTANIKMND